MKLRNRLTGLSMLCMLVLLSGCDRNEGIPFMAEDAEPLFEKGRQLSRQGRNPEALASFLKVIAKRGDEAPESHLEVAILYQQHLNDHIAAIYHFRKFPELQPNSKMSEHVRQRIETSRREFARALPANPLESANIRLNYVSHDEFEALRRENEQLKGEIQALRAGVATVPITSPNNYRAAFDIQGAAIPTQATPIPTEADPETPPADASPEETSPFMKAPDSTSTAEVSGNKLTAGIRLPDLKAPTPAPAASTAQGTPAKVEASRPAETPAKTESTAATKAGRKHVVQAKDTLSSISQRYYGTRSRVKDIIQANKDQLKGEHDTLRLGMELRIP